jgi:hypothetical protein
MKSNLVTLSCAAIVLTFGLSSTAMAASVKASLSGAQEVPANDSKGKGELTGTFDPATKKLTYKVTYSGLTGDATAAHFHGPAAAGKNAGVAVPVSGSVASPIEGTATLTDDQAKALQAGEMYFNVHTKANAGGEIRGQVSVK